MEPFVFILVLTAAFSHAVWNFFSKKVSGNFTIFWYGLLFANLLILPYTFFSILRSGFDSGGIPLLLISSIVHGLYYFALLYTYVRGDISTAYPIARGTGVAGTAVISYFILKEVIALNAAIGIITILSGILFIGAARVKNQVYQKKSYFIALLTGVFIFIYSIVDKLGVQKIDPVVFINFVDLTALALLFPFANREGVKKSFRTAMDSLKETLIIGLGSSGTYILILFALKFERASYIVPMREFSVVIASVMGFLFLKEKLTPFKMAGIILITSGLVLIRLG